MRDKMSLDDVSETVQSFRVLTQAVDKLVKQRAAEPLFVLPSKNAANIPEADADRNSTAALIQAAASPLQQLQLPHALTRTQGPQGSDTPSPYPGAHAAASQAAKAVTSYGITRTKLTSAGKSYTKQPSDISDPNNPRSTSTSTTTTTKPIPGTQVADEAKAKQDLARGARAVLALPGQLPYRQMLYKAQKSRAVEAQQFIREMDGLDEEIDSYLADDRYNRAIPGAAVTVQTAWRSRGPRMFFNRYAAQCRRANLHALSDSMSALCQLTAAIRNHRHRLLATCLHEWRDMHELKMLLFSKLLKKLKASMAIDVRDSQSPNHLWRLCTSPGQDPWSAKISLGSLCRNLIHSQAPRRRLQLYFNSWRRSVAAVSSGRHQAIQILAKLESTRSWEHAHMLFRFWYRWSQVKLSERLNITPPLFRPRMPEWDTWLWEHTRSVELRGRVVQLHRGFRLRHCFGFWRKFAARNMAMRAAWMGAAVPQIEALMRYALGCLKANWQQAKAQRRLRKAVFRSWLMIARRNVLVRKIANKAEAISRKSIKRLVFRRLRVWCNQSKLLAMGTTVQLIHRRPLCMIPLCAWTGDIMQMWFVSTWHAWKNLVLGKLRMRCFLVNHLQRQQFLGLELAFKAWRKVIQEQAKQSDWVAEQHEAREQLRQERAVRRQMLTRQTSSFGHQPSILTNSTSQQAGTNPTSTLANNNIFSSQTNTANNGQGVSGDRSNQLHPVTSHALLQVGAEGSMAALAGSEVWNEADDNDGLEEDELVEELQEGSVLVTLADYPAASLWRPWQSLSDEMHAMDFAPMAGYTHSDIRQTVKQLTNLEGRYLPTTTSDHQLILEVGKRAGNLVTVQNMLKSDYNHQISLWMENHLEEGDPWMWQQFVGMVAGNMEYHADAPCGPMVDHETLPWSREVGRLKLRQAASRMRMNTSNVTNSSQGHNDESGDGATSHAMPYHQWSVRTRSTEHGCPGGLDAEQKELMWLYKLAFCEALLEGAVAGLLRVGHKHMPWVYQSVLASKKRQTAIQTLEGDLLVEVLTGSLRHDLAYMSSVSTYRRNRDRVITMGMSLHSHALALHRHCPEFTLTYPDYNPTGTWADAIEKVDNEDPDAPPPMKIRVQAPALNICIPPTPTVMAPPTPQPASQRQEVIAAQSNSRRSTPSNLSRVKSLIRPALTTAEKIKLEMLGIVPPPLPSTTLPVAELDAPTSGRGSRLSTPPSRPGTSGKTTLQGAMDNGSRPASRSSDRASPITTRTSVPCIEPVVEEVPSSVAPVSPRKQVALDDAKFHGVVLGAAAAAILEARAAAARREHAGHRPPNQAQITQILSKPEPYKQAWRPSGYRKTSEKDKDSTKEPRIPRTKRLPPLPDLGQSERDRKRDMAANKTLSSLKGLLLSPGASGQAAGDAAFHAMLQASASQVPMTPSDLATDSLPTCSEVTEVQEVVVTTTIMRAVPPVPSEPYFWFASDDRYFPTVADIPIPSEVPTLQELYSRATQLAVERLDSSLPSIPLMPAIIYTSMGDPLPTRSTRSRRSVVYTRHTAADMETHVDCKEGQSTSQNVSSVPDTCMDVSELKETTSTASLKLPSAMKRSDAVKSLDGSKKARLAELGIAGLLAPAKEDSGHQTVAYRSALGKDMLGSCAYRVSDIGEMSPRVDDDANSMASPRPTSRGSLASRGAEGIDAEDTCDCDENEDRTVGFNEEPEKPTFRVAPEQLNIYLGGHVRVRKHASLQRQATCDEQQDIQQSTTQQQLTPLDGDFAARYNPDRVLRATSAQRKNLLEGYDLRDELCKLLGPGFEALVGAEVVLLGERELSYDEQVALQQELDRLEVQLAGSRRNKSRHGGTHSNASSPRSPRQYGAVRDSWSRLPLSQRTSPASSPRLTAVVSAGDMSPRDGGVFSIILESPRGSNSQNANHANEPEASQSGHTVTSVPATARVAESPRVKQTQEAANAVVIEPLLVQRPNSVSAWDIHPVSELQDLQLLRAASSQKVMGATSSAGLAQSRSDASNAHTLVKRPSANDRSVNGCGFVRPISSSSAMEEGMRPGSGTASSIDLTCDSNVQQESAFEITVYSSLDQQPDLTQTVSKAEQCPTHANAGLFLFKSTKARSHRTANIRTMNAQQPQQQVMPQSDHSVDPSRSTQQPSGVSNTTTSTTVSLAIENGNQGCEVPQAVNVALAAPGTTSRSKNVSARNSATLLTPICDTNDTRGLDANSIQELEALKAMWSADLYSGTQNVNQSGQDVMDIINEAAQADWQRYEESADLLVEQLSGMIAQKETLHGITPSQLNDTSCLDQAGISSLAASYAFVGVEDGLDVSGMGIGNKAVRPGTEPKSRSPLHRALALMDDHVAACLDSDRLTGLDVSQYPAALSDLVSRLVVAPMATKYLFWKKVQSIGMMAQRLREDKALAAQLAHICWSATFTTGHVPRPSGWSTPADTASQTAHTPASVTGAPAGLRLPSGWSSGALSVLTAPRSPWASAIPQPVTGLGLSPGIAAVTAAVPIQQPIVLRPRDDTPIGAPRYIDRMDAPIHGQGIRASAQGVESLQGQLTWNGHVWKDAEGVQHAAKMALQQRLGVSLQGAALEQQTPIVHSQMQSSVDEAHLSTQRFLTEQGAALQEFTQLQGRELLARRLEALLVERRRTQHAPPAVSPTCTPQSGMYGLYDCARDDEMVGLEREEAQVERLARLTIAVNKDALTKHQQRINYASSTLIPGKGHMSGWAPPSNNDTRDAFQLLPSCPFAAPPRPRQSAIPSPPAVITLKGAAVPRLTALHYDDAQTILPKLANRTGPVAIGFSAQRLLSSDDLAPNLPHPYGQSRPSHVLPSLARVPSPPAHPASEKQLGNVLFSTPHVPAYVNSMTKALDNTYLPGPHAVGGITRLNVETSMAASWGFEVNKKADTQPETRQSTQAVVRVSSGRAGPWTPSSR